MIVKLKMKTDLMNQTTRPVVMVPQNDGDCRILEMELYAGQETWQVPEGASVRLYYVRADGTGGSYDAREDGSSAWQVDGNILTMTLVPQMFAVAGNLAAKVEFLLGEKRLNTFDFWIQVVHDCTESAVECENYFNWSAWTNQELERMLVEAKESGDFTGPQGKQGVRGETGVAGYTPVKGVDYYTDAEKAEWDAYIASELAKRGQLKPEFAQTIEECTDPTKLYVLPDGYIYAYMTKSGTVVKTLTAEDYGIGNMSVNGLPQSGVQRVYTTELLPLGDGNVTSISRSSPYDFIVYFYNTDNPTETNANTLSSDLTGKTTWNVASVDDVRNVTCTTGTMAGATHFRVAIRNHDSTTNIGTIEAALSGITITHSAHGEVTGFVNTGHAFVPADYEDRIVALEQALEGIEYGTY